jgi:hypothetical protein
VAPSVPTSVSATASAFNSVGVSWTASTDNFAVTRYAISRGGTPLAVVNGTVTTFTDRSTTASTAYAYTVKALDAAASRLSMGYSIRLLEREIPLALRRSHHQRQLVATLGMGTHQPLA